MTTQKNDKPFNIRARKAVVLATGGFEYNEELKREFLAGYPIFAYGNAGNTGDGIKLAQELGRRSVAHESRSCTHGIQIFRIRVRIHYAHGCDGYIIVDQNGERFCNETGLEHYSMWMAVTSFDMESLRFSRIPSYLIFDEQTRPKGPITRVGHGANRGYQWSRDNSEEIRRGWIASANGPRELAEKLGIKAAEKLTRQLMLIGGVQNGSDEKFGRSKKPLWNLTASFMAFRCGPVY